MKYRTDLILGEAFSIFIFIYFLYSGLSELNGLQFYFWLRDSENREFGEIGLEKHIFSKTGGGGGGYTMYICLPCNGFSTE